MMNRVEWLALGMQCRVRKQTAGSLLALLIWVSGTDADSLIQLSFLDKPAVLQDTVERLRQAGCGSSSVDGFLSLIGKQDKLFEAPSMDVGVSIEKRLDSIETPADLYALGAPGYPSLMRWRRYPKRHMLTCFDLALLLLREGPVSASQVLNDFNEKYFRNVQTYSRGGVQRFEVSSLECDGVLTGGQLLSSDRIYESQTQLPARSANELRLALSLRSVRSIPGHYANTEVALSQLFETKIQMWREDGIVFSDKVRVVQCHFVDLRGKFVGVDHIGLLLKKERGWMYVEKNGSTSPVVRLDFERIDQLVDYLAMMFEEDAYDPRSPLHFAAFMISINDELHRIVLGSREAILHER